jgi:hypothetical protein
VKNGTAGRDAAARGCTRAQVRAGVTGSVGGVGPALPVDSTPEEPEALICRQNAHRVVSLANPFGRADHVRNLSN